MRSFNRALAIMLAVALLLVSTITGLVLPVAAEGDTFKMGYDHLYVAPADSSGYVTYVAVPLYTPDGQPYTETVTWSLSNSKLGVSDSKKGIFKTVKNVSGDVTITATNAAGESHSCVVTVCFDGEMIAGGDFESLACQTGFSSDRWTNVIKSGKGQVVTDPDDTTNHVLKFPANISTETNYSGLRCEPNREYVVSFDIKGDTGEIKPITFPADYVTVLGSNTGYFQSGNWQYATPKAGEWKHYEFHVKTKASINRNYILGFGSMSVSGTNTNPFYLDNVSMYEVGTAESVTLDTAEQSLMIGESTNLTYTYAPAGSTVNRAKWSSSNESVATVDENGKVTAISPGEATITLKCGLLTTTCAVTVTKVAAKGIALNKTELEMNAGDEETLTVSVVPEGAELAEEITWRSTDESVATVVNGTVTAVRGGTATIIATAGDFTAACVVNVSKASASDTFQLAKDELRLSPSDGNYYNYSAVPALTPDGQPYKESLTWTTSNSGIVAIDNTSTGLFHTVKDAKGTAVITATNAAGESHSCKVVVEWDGERIAGGDFESVAANTSRWTSEVVKSGKGEITLDPHDNSNHVLMLPANLTPGGSGAPYYRNLTYNPNKKYMLSFDIKGDTGSVMPITLYKYVTVTGSNTGSYNSSNWQTVTPKADEWTHYVYYFTAKSTIDRAYTLGFGNNTAKPVYLDNLSLIELGEAEGIEVGSDEVKLEVGDSITVPVTSTPANSRFNYPTWESNNPGVAMVDKDGKITALSAGNATITVTSRSASILTATITVKVYNELLDVTPDVSLQNGSLSSDAVFGELEAGDIVTVTVTPNNGYIMVPGSLKYTLSDGTTMRILNESWTTLPEFGRESAGNTFQFEMPDKRATISAEFVPTTEQNFQVNTIGTSFHYYVNEDDERVYDGIRFLTRMNLAVTFDENSSTMTVLYGGKEYTVLELGSLLKREENKTELNYANALANQSTSGNGRMWVSKAYTANSGVFKLVDYTDSYIDFASIMMTTHYDRFYTARGYARLQDADGQIITIECDEITNSISAVVPILPPVQTVDGLVVDKTASLPASHAIGPNEKITYTLTVKNEGSESGPVTVFDPIPENTTYVDGADDFIAKNAVWTATINAGETKTFSYTVRVDNDTTLCNGGTVEPTTAQVGNVNATIDYPIYIERVVNSADAKYFNKAMKALGDSHYSDMTFVYWAYYTSFTSGFTGYRTESVYDGYSAAEILNSIINGTGITSYSYTDSTGKAQSGTNNHLDNIAPTLFGGADITGPIEGVKGAPAASVSEKDLMIGDVIIVKVDDIVSLYIYCDKGLMKVKSIGGTEQADMALLNTLTTSQAYVVLRPRTGFTSTTSSNPDEIPAEESYTPEQNAVIKTAEAFFMRGDKVQYSDTDYNYGGPAPYNGSYTEYRWKIREDSPEDATIDNIKYTNCAAFTFDSYYFALNYDIDMFTTSQLAGSTKYKVFNFLREKSGSTITATHTEEEKAEIAQQFLDTLQPGDLMVVRRTDTSGHVMMYIGNGKMIHCSGSVYRYGGNGKPAVEIVEPAILYGQVEDYFLKPTASNYIFGSRVYHTVIVRPLNGFTKAIPQNTQNRLNNLSGIVAQKLVPYSLGKTVNTGTELTFTFDLRNTNDEPKTLTIVENLPAGATHLSNTGNGVVANGTITWNVTLAANEHTTVTYTMRVNDDTASGTKIVSTTTINDVAVDCPAITVGNTFTETEQTAIVDALKELIANGTELRDFELINKIYKNAGIQDVTFADTDLETVALGEKGFVKNISTTSTLYYAMQPSTESSTYRNMIAPTLYGGERLHTPRWTHDRTRLVYESDMVIGDIIIFRNGYYSNGYRMYLYTGENTLYSLTEGKYDTITTTAQLERLLGRPNWEYSTHYFAVLRPSLVME